MNKVKIYGAGWVGKAVKGLFPDALVYDPHLGLLDTGLADFGCICVPTPLKSDGSLDASIVEDVVKNAKEEILIIRSTVNPGDCDRWTKLYKKNIVFQAEFLGETPNHPLLDETKRQFIVIGGEPQLRRKVIDLYATVYNSNITIRQLTLYEAEIAKLTENRAIGFKVMQLHELYEACEKAGVDYYTIRDTVYGDDPRFNLWFSFIYANNLGFDSSKCLKKDIPAWAAWAESIGYNPEITNLLVKKSREYAKN
jgi:UDPglucose 6-dehydrogenase